MADKGVFPLVYLQWCDAFEYTDGWLGLEEVRESAKSQDWLVHSVGWLIEDTKQYVLIASAWNQDGSFSGVLKIPTTWVKRRKLYMR